MWNFVVPDKYQEYSWSSSSCYPTEKNWLGLISMVDVANNLTLCWFHCIASHINVTAVITQRMCDWYHSEWSQTRWMALRCIFHETFVSYPFNCYIGPCQTSIFCANYFIDLWFNWNVLLCVRKKEFYERRTSDMSISTSQHLPSIQSKSYNFAGRYCFMPNKLSHLLKIRENSKWNRFHLRFFS